MEPNALLKMKQAPTLKDSLYKLLLKKRNLAWTVEQLCDHFNCGPANIRKAIETLAAEGKNFGVHNNMIELATEIRKGEPLIIDQRHLTGQKVRFGVVSDNHLGSKYERLDVLKALYAIFEEAGIKTVYNAGNMIDGEARFNKYDLHKHGLEDQVNYLVDVYPKGRGITTYYVTGDDHEGWFTWATWNTILCLKPNEGKQYSVYSTQAVVAHMH